MAEREVKIRVSAEDAGATPTIQRLTKQMAELAAAGEDTAIVFSAEFHDAQVEKRVNEIVAQMQAAADKHKITLEANLEARSIERDAQRSLFGERQAPLRLLDRSREEQTFRNAQAEALRAGRGQRPGFEGYGGGFDPRNAPGAGGGGGAAASALGRAIGNEAGEAAGKGFFDRLKQFAGGRGPLKDVGELLVGGGAVAGVTFLAKAIGDAALSGDAMVTAFRKGQISTREMTSDILRAYPVMGQMIHMWDGIGKLARNVAGLPSVEDKKVEGDRKLDERRADAEVRAKALADQARKQGQFRDSLTDTNRDIGDSNRTRGRLGRDQEIAQAANEMARRSAEADKLVKDAVNSKVGAPLIEEAKKTAAAMKQAALADYLQVEKETQKRYNEEQLQLQAEHDKAMLSARGKAQQEQLQQQGLNLTAEIEGYKSAFQQELADLRQSLKEKTKDLEDIDPRRAEAQKRFDEQSAAAEDLMRLRIAAANRNEANRQADERSAFDKSIKDQAADSLANRFRAAGRDQRAEQITAGRQYLDKLDEINQEAERKVRDHAEQKDAILAQAAQSRSAAGDAYQSELAAGAANRITRSSGLAAREDVGLLTGVAEQSQARSGVDRQIKLSEDMLKVLNDIKTALRNNGQGAAAAQLTQ